mmetsp:Transcript_28884/g.51490  ORF Transcript_28884/g.51490 Transcript_28884/m.51490 type:complete len:128 (+) Transcript_28884:2475-2858(+)
MRQLLSLVVFIALIIDLPYYVPQANRRFPILVCVKVACLVLSFMSLVCGCYAAKKLLKLTGVTFAISSFVHTFQLVFFMRSAAYTLCEDWICLERHGDCDIEGPGNPQAYLHMLALCVLLTLQVTPT